MDKEIQDDKPEKKEPFNHVLEVQNGRIDLSDLLKRADRKVVEVTHGEISSR